MSLPRFFINSPINIEDNVLLDLDATEYNHILVRRIEPGEHIAVFAEGNKSWEVEILSVDNGEVYVKVIKGLKVKKLPNLTLVQGISKGDRMGQTIRQTTELGIQKIIPFLSERTIVRVAHDERAHKGDRWRRIALSAAKQSGRTILPIVNKPATIEKVIGKISDYDRVVIAWEDADKDADDKPLSLGKALAGCDMDSKVAIVIGPEGGLSENEINTFRDAFGQKVKVCSLGHLKLRTETAGTVAVALALYILGSLGNE
ncbi:MAG: 16S rRNA (uracil(1498)-N(3))-methyltransferase [Coriobacteriales bacterium]|nr:16S rRNA (uracil(1498)-N(3))-methyltransferase [Coriobacteriales bacterium]